MWIALMATIIMPQVASILLFRVRLGGKKPDNSDLGL